MNKQAFDKLHTKNTDVYQLLVEANLANQVDNQIKIRIAHFMTIKKD